MAWQDALAQAGAPPPVAPPTADVKAPMLAAQAEPTAEDQMAALAALCSRLTMQGQRLEAEAGDHYGELLTRYTDLASRCARLERQLAEAAHAITRLQWDLAGIKAHPALRPIEEPEPCRGKPVCTICQCWIDEGAKRHCVIAGCPAKCES